MIAGGRVLVLAAMAVAATPSTGSGHGASAGEWDPWTPSPASAAVPSTGSGRGAPADPDLSRPLDLLALGAIRLYQVAISPVLPTRCGFEPSCSRYTAACIARFGLVNGTLLGADRITRCHSLAALDEYPLATDGRLRDDPAEAVPPLRWLAAFGL